MAATVTVTGTVTTPGVTGKLVGTHGVYFRDCGDTDFDAKTSAQRGLNLYDEANQFVAALAAALQVPGFVIIDQLRVIFATMRRTPTMGETPYAP